MLLVGLAIKFGGELPAGMLLADGGADAAVAGSRHQVWRWAPGMVRASGGTDNAVDSNTS